MPRRLPHIEEANEGLKLGRALANLIITARATNDGSQVAAAAGAQGLTPP